MKGFTEEQRMKLATVYAMIFANSKLLTFTRTEKIEKMELLSFLCLWEIEFISSALFTLPLCNVSVVSKIFCIYCKFSINLFDKLIH